MARWACDECRREHLASPEWKVGPWAKQTEKPATVTAGVIPKLTRSMSRDDNKIKAIPKCIENGIRHVTLGKVD